MTNDNAQLPGHGGQYRVREVAGHTPVSLDDVVGATTVTVESRGHEYRLIGAGVKHGKIVLFQQMDAGSALGTGPVWTMSVHADGGLTAQPPLRD